MRVTASETPGDSKSSDQQLGECGRGNLVCVTPTPEPSAQLYSRLRDELYKGGIVTPNFRPNIVFVDPTEVSRESWGKLGSSDDMDNARGLEFDRQHVLAAVMRCMGGLAPSRTAHVMPLSCVGPVSWIKNPTDLTIDTGMLTAQRNVGVIPVMSSLVRVGHEYFPAADPQKLAEYIAKKLKMPLVNL